MKKVMYLLAMLPMAFISCGDDDNNGGKNEGNNNTYSSMVNDWIKEDVNHESVVGNLYDFLYTKSLEAPTFEVTNISSVTQGEVLCPEFTINEPMLLFCIQTYHWNYINYKDESEVVYSWVEDKNGRKYGLDSPTTWQYGQGQRPMANWYTFPMVEIPAGTYTVECSSHETWSHNYSSNNYGFCQVFCIPLEKNKGNNKKDEPISQDIQGDWYWGTGQGNNAQLHLDEDGTWYVENTEKNVPYWRGTYQYTNNTLKLTCTYDFNVLNEVSESNPSWGYYTVEVVKVTDSYWAGKGYTIQLFLENQKKGDGDTDVIGTLTHGYYR